MTLNKIYEIMGKQHEALYNVSINTLNVDDPTGSLTNITPIATNMTEIDSAPSGFEKAIDSLRMFSVLEPNF